MTHVFLADLGPRDLMQCGEVLHYDADGAIVGDHDYVLSYDGRVNCKGCKKVCLRCSAPIGREVAA